MKTIIVLIITAILFSLPVPASAHILKLDGTIGVTMHMEPDDSPIAGNLDDVFITLEDRTGRLKSDNPRCLCTLSVWQNGKQLDELPIVNAGQYLPISYAFPNSGVYQLRVTGTPEDERFNFDSFEVEFEYYARSAQVRMSASATNTNPLKRAFPFVATVAASLAAYLIINLIPRKEVKI